MTSVQLRRLTSQKPEENVRVTNTLVDMLKGNQTGRIFLNGDGGLEKALQGGAQVASLVPALMIRPDSGEQAWLKHSNNVDTVFRAQDSGVTIKTLAVTANATIAGTLGVTGLATLGSLAVTNNATVGGTLGVTGLTTVAALTATGAVTTQSTVTMKNGSGGSTVVLVTPSTPLVTVTAPLVVNPSAAAVAATGDVRGARTFSLKARNNANGADLPIVTMDGADNVVFGALTGIQTAYLAGEAAVSVFVDSTQMIRVEPTGTTISLDLEVVGEFGCNGQAPQGPATLSGSAGATYDATTRTLINDIRDALQANGICD